MKFISKILGTTPSIDKIVEYLNHIPLNRQQCRTEKQAESNIQKQLIEIIDKSFHEVKVHTQYSVGGNMGLKIDIDIADDIGIEIKLANQLIGNATNFQRAIGQAIYYSWKLYGNDIILLVIGSEKDRSNPDIKELQEICENQEFNFHYKIV